ncbi:hypothetical protein [Neolewinella antarctica]|uniref:ABC transporter permease n=1 Tax=Neolewinella antarctica TaxID=442734 RepID=A0ABX0XD72_9BACT|nr:hypothetical protein [Neolewinella antarctica]NJC26869.1 hypothetical protein [Neolewinella antarctica]
MKILKLPILGYTIILVQIIVFSVLHFNNVSFLLIDVVKLMIFYAVLLSVLITIFLTGERSQEFLMASYETLPVTRRDIMIANVKRIATNPIINLMVITFSIGILSLYKESLFDILILLVGILGLTIFIYFQTVLVNRISESVSAMDLPLYLQIFNLISLISLYYLNANDDNLSVVTWSPWSGLFAYSLGPYLWLKLILSCALYSLLGFSLFSNRI